MISPSFALGFCGPFNWERFSWRLLSVRSPIMNIGPAIAGFLRPGRNFGGVLGGVIEDRRCSLSKATLIVYEGHLWHLRPSVESCRAAGWGGWPTNQEAIHPSQSQQFDSRLCKSCHAKLGPK